MRLVFGAAALCLVAFAPPLQARPYTVEDLLAAEEVGEMAFSPDGRRLVFERFGPLGTAAPFDQDIYWELRRSRLEIAEVAGDGAARPLLDLGEATGLSAGPFSPDGRRLVVLRCEGLTYEAGVVELETGAVRWLGIAPELGLVGRTLAWRPNDALLVAALPTGDAPLRCVIERVPAGKLARAPLGTRFPWFPIPSHSVRLAAGCAPLHVRSSCPACSHARPSFAAPPWRRCSRSPAFPPWHRSRSPPAARRCAWTRRSPR